MVVSGIADQVGRVLGGRYRLVAPIGTGASAQSTWPTTCSSAGASRSRCCTPRSPTTRRSSSLPRRGAGRRVAQPPEHHGRLRLGRGRRAVPGPRAPRRRQPARRSSTGPPADAPQALVVGLEAARPRPPTPRLRAPRHQAGQPALRRGRPAAHRRLRPGPRAGRGGVDRAGRRPWSAPPATPRPSRRRRRVDGRADVYSLALVLVEAVTGQVPCVADTTLATLMARLDAPIPVARRARDRCAPVVERAGRPDPPIAPTPPAGAVRSSALRRELTAPGPFRSSAAEPVDGATVTRSHDDDVAAASTDGSSATGPTTPDRRRRAGRRSRLRGRIRARRRCAVGAAAAHRPHAPRRWGRRRHAATQARVPTRRADGRPGRSEARRAPRTASSGGRSTAGGVQRRRRRRCGPDAPIPPPGEPGGRRHADADRLERPARRCGVPELVGKSSQARDAIADAGLTVGDVTPGQRGRSRRHSSSAGRPTAREAGRGADR